MILHCTLPYRQDIPNPALGYLKGFLEAQGVPVKTVYWNLVLARTILNFHKGIEKYSKETGLSSIEGITLFLCRHLLESWNEENIRNKIKDKYIERKKTPMDLIFSSVFSQEEITNIVSSFRDEIDQFIRTSNLHQAPVHGFTLKTHQWLMSYYVIYRLKEMNPETRIVIGGITSESQARHFMTMMAQADFAIWGEGEYPLLCLMKALEGNTFDTVPNLVYRKDNLEATTIIPECPPLDTYPFADHSDYFGTFRRYVPPQLPVLIPIWGSRSCPWNKCKFCVLNEEYSYRARSPENIVEEIEYQSEKYKNDSFIFVDTELPGNKKRFKTLLRLLFESSSRRKKPYHFHAEISPVFIDNETAKLMQLASFTSIQIGFEAMTDSLLEKMQKRHKFAHNIQALKLGNQYSLKIGGLNIIRAIPPETEEDVAESCINVSFLRFLLKRYSLSPNFLSLFKESPFYDEVPRLEREHWKENPFFVEAALTGLVSDDERFEFFGFCPDTPPHYHLWADFERVILSYVSQNRSYEWIEYGDGSFVEEKGPKTYRYTLDKDETAILIYCDSVRSLEELKKEFPHLGEDNIRKIMTNLKDAGMIYHDKDLNTIISILEAYNRKTLKRVTIPEKKKKKKGILIYLSQHVLPHAPDAQSQK